jgi:hypothetical protein
VRRTRNPEAVEVPAAEVHVIEPNAVYFPDTAQRILRLKKSTLRREVREHRLRIARRAGRYYLLGRWILEWLEAGELPRHRTATTNGQADP